jgi:hypothetical protein
MKSPKRISSRRSYRAGFTLKIWPGYEPSLHCALMHIGFSPRDFSRAGF